MAAGWIALHLTDRCQLDCQHCLRDPAQKPTDLSVELIRRVLGEARRRYRTNQVSLTGGEPTLHPRLPEVLDAIVDEEMTWHLVTNGVDFDGFLDMVEARGARRNGLTGVNFSLDGAREETHDRIRGSGSFRRVMQAVARARASALSFSLNLTINSLNVAELETLAFDAAQLGASRVQFNMLQATGTHLDANLRLSVRAWRDVLDRIARLKDALKIAVEATEGFEREGPFHVCDPFRSEILHIDVHGRLNLCCQHAGIPSAEDPAPDVAADLRETSLVEGHRRLLDIIHATQAAKLRAIDAGELDEWDSFPCNWCMKHFGKPHWTAEGPSGPSAVRERWRGAWDRDRHPADGDRRRRLPIAP